jgi:hypothetical protein
MKSVILLTLIFLFSCNEVPEKTIFPSHIKNIPVSETKYCPYCYIGLITNPDKLIALLNDSNQVETSHLGAAGTYSETYATYERLKEISSDTTLRNYTSHANPKVRIYAMWALAKKNKAMALQELPKHITDNSMVYYQSGCMIMFMNTSTIILQEFDSLEIKDALKRLPTR